MTSYDANMLAYCKAQLKQAETERNPVLIAYYTARISEIESCQHM